MLAGPSALRRPTTIPDVGVGAARVAAPEADLDAWRTGDEVVVMAFVLSHRPGLFRPARRHVADDATAHEIVQEGAAGVAVGRPGLSPPR